MIRKNEQFDDSSLILSNLNCTFCFSCRQVDNLSEAVYRILPNYCATYGPLVIALILCPTLYIYSWKQTRFVIIRGLNQVTSRERAALRIFKIKFALITLALYFCWLPNLITSIILWSSWGNYPSKLIVSFWYIMVINLLYFLISPDKLDF